MFPLDLQYLSRRGNPPNGVLRVTNLRHVITQGTSMVLSADIGFARELVLPNARSVEIGHIVGIKDISGKCRTYNITVVPYPRTFQTIDGAESFVLKWDYAGADFISDGQNWFLCP